MVGKILTVFIISLNFTSYVLSQSEVFLNVSSFDRTYVTEKNTSICNSIFVCEALPDESYCKKLHTIKKHGQRLKLDSTDRVIFNEIGVNQTKFFEYYFFEKDSVLYGNVFSKRFSSREFIPLSYYSNNYLVLSFLNHNKKYIRYQTFRDESDSLIVRIYSIYEVEASGEIDKILLFGDPNYLIKLGRKGRIDIFKCNNYFEGISREDILSLKLVDLKISNHIKSVKFRKLKKFNPLTSETYLRNLIDEID